ncbi:nucleotidyltransferase domain-containing protein [Patescibacteria group bacterium]|nr:nucleotidyltransferase domain-containing protein [Patescibacteria group bacterium]
MRKKPPKKFKGSKPARTRATGLQKSILNTLKYRQLFDCPMTSFELWQYLIAGSAPSPTLFQKELAELVKSGKVICRENFYALHKLDLDKIRQKRKRAERMQERAKQICRYLEPIPWIELAAITGSVAAHNAEENCDIDILIVTKPGRLYLSRLFLVPILKLLGVYWTKQKPAGTICPNIMLTTTQLTWQPAKQNLYTANELALLYPLFSRHNCYFDFLRDNGWVNTYLPNFIVPSKKRSASKNRPASKSLDLLEYLAREVQLRYMRSKKTTETVTADFVHFNNRDSAPAILQKYQKS